MTVILKNTKKDKTREFDSKEEAEDQRNQLIGIGADPSNLVVVENGEEDTSDSESQEGGQNESQEETNGTTPKEAEVVEKRRSEEIEELHEQTQSQMQSPGIEDEEAFVTEVKGVPDTFVVNMGTPQNKSIHIKKEGYYYLASQMDLQFRAEPINPTWEGDSDTSAFRGVVEDNGGRTWTNVGTAHKQGEDMQGAQYNLDELAATRAATRALSMATGTGVASMEEMIGGDNAE